MAINRIEKLIINLDTEQPVACAWDDCWRRARTSHQVRVHEHTGKCSEVQEGYGRHIIYAFCSESCMDYWVACTGTNAHMTASMRRGKIHGMHSAGGHRGVL
jgi:hypothetical protein